MFSEPILRQSHTARQRQANVKEYSDSFLGPSLTDSVLTENTLLPCSARWTELSGGQVGMLGLSCFGNIP